MIRYRDGKIVSTKGERFTQVTKAESDEMKKSYVNIPNYDYGYIWQRLDSCNFYIFNSSNIMTKSIVAVNSTALNYVYFLAIIFHITQSWVFCNFCKSLRMSIYFTNINVTNTTKVPAIALKHKVLWQKVHVYK